MKYLLVTASLVIIFIISSCSGDKGEYILFTSDDGMVEAPIAAHYFNIQAEKVGLKDWAISRASKPSVDYVTTLSSYYLKRLKRVGIIIGDISIKRLKQSDIDGAKLFYCFDTIPDKFKVTECENWNGSHIPFDNDYDKTALEVKEKVDALIATLTEN